MARLDRLAPVREIAQVGATLGREFSYELLHAVSPLDEADLTARAAAVSGSGAGVSARAAPAGHLSLQACPDSGRSLSVVAQEQTTAISPADCPGVGEAVS